MCRCGIGCQLVCLVWLQLDMRPACWSGATLFSWSTNVQARENRESKQIHDDVGKRLELLKTSVSVHFNSTSCHHSHFKVAGATIQMVTRRERFATRVSFLLLFFLHPCLLTTVLFLFPLSGTPLRRPSTTDGKDLRIGMRDDERVVG